MGRLCERPGCSEPGAASYGMLATDLLFWVDTLHPADGQDTGVLCRRHADAMVVPRGWTLDDRREPRPRLFRASPDATSVGGGVRPARRRTRSTSAAPGDRVEQLELSATWEAPAPEVPAGSDADAPADPDPAVPWVPEFDSDDDLDGLLHVDSPLLARAFRGTGRSR